MSVNKIILLGNVGRDPEVRTLEGGNKVASFTLATTDKYKDRNGEIKEATEWHNIVAWNQPATVAEQYVRKGTQLFIEGKVKTRSYQTQQGEKKFVTEVMVDRLQLLGAPQQQNRPQQAAQAPQGYYQPTVPSAAPQQAPRPQQQAAPAMWGGDINDLPF